MPSPHIIHQHFKHSNLKFKFKFKFKQNIWSKSLDIETKVDSLARNQATSPAVAAVGSAGWRAEIVPFLDILQKRHSSRRNFCVVHSPLSETFAKKLSDFLGIYRQYTQQTKQQFFKKNLSFLIINPPSFLSQKFS